VNILSWWGARTEAGGWVEGVDLFSGVLGVAAENIPEKLVKKRCRNVSLPVASGGGLCSVLYIGCVEVKQAWQLMVTTKTEWKMTGFPSSGGQ
jgi:hypothetical protein